MMLALRLLTAPLAFDVPEQKLKISRSRMPALPADRFVLTGVQVSARIE